MPDLKRARQMAEAGLRDLEHLENMDVHGLSLKEHEVRRVAATFEEAARQVMKREPVEAGR